jgi:hypothetical protein
VCQTNTYLKIGRHLKDKPRASLDSSHVMIRDKPTAVLLDSAVDLMFEIYLLRGDCSAAAQALIQNGQRHEAAVEDCARLDDALAKTYRSLQRTIRSIQASRARRKHRAA